MWGDKGGKRGKGGLMGRKRGKGGVGREGGVRVKDLMLLRGGFVAGGRREDGDGGGWKVNWAKIRRVVFD